MLVASFDDALGMIVTIATGFQDEPEVQRHLDALEALVKRARSRTGRALHLVDATQAAVQPSSGSATIIKEAFKGRIKVDRCAVVTRSALGKMQIQRLYSGLPVQVFNHRHDALAWLQSFQPLARAS